MTMAGPLGKSIVSLKMICIEFTVSVVDDAFYENCASSGV
jgi:hypothetical protein